MRQRGHHLTSKWSFSLHLLPSCPPDSIPALLELVKLVTRVSEWALLPCSPTEEAGEGGWAQIDTGRRAHSLTLFPTLPPYLPFSLPFCHSSSLTMTRASGSVRCRCPTSTQTTCRHSQQTRVSACPSNKPHCPLQNHTSMSPTLISHTKPSHPLFLTHTCSHTPFPPSCVSPLQSST
jgi:hypothetical protein